MTLKFSKPLKVENILETNFLNFRKSTVVEINNKYFLKKKVNKFVQSRQFSCDYRLTSVRRSEALGAGKSTLKFLSL